jgi:hypothetical protein
MPNRDHTPRRWRDYPGASSFRKVVVSASPLSCLAFSAGDLGFLSAAGPGQVIRGTLLLVIILAILGGLIFLTIKRAYDPAEIVVKWCITLPVLAFLVLAILFLSVLAPFIAVGCAVVLSFVWTPHLGSALAGSLTNIFDGGRGECEPRPLYSIAIAKQKRGDLNGALQEIHKQLERFPGDPEGLLRMSEIQGQGLKDLSAAERSVNELLEQPGLAGNYIASALMSLADMHLSVGKDPAAARDALRRIADLLPGSEFAQLARRRIAHLGDSIVLPHMDDAPIELHHGHGRAVDDPEKETAELVQHLQTHPSDTEAREQLARHYAQHYDRLDLATDQLETMITDPLTPLATRFVGLTCWGSATACGAELADVRRTLMRVVDLDPYAAAANRARSRLDLLALELRGKQKSQAVKLGSYEQNLGLKKRPTS